MVVMKGMPGALSRKWSRLSFDTNARGYGFVPQAAGGKALTWSGHLDRPATVAASRWGQGSPRLQPIREYPVWAPLPAPTA